MVITNQFRLKRAAVWLLGLAALLLVQGCLGDGEKPDSSAAADPSQRAVGSCTLGLTLEEDAETAIAALLRGEGEKVVAQEIEGLMALWSDQGVVVDAKHTAADTSDDQLWEGADAIRHRYVRLVFPGAPALAQPADLQINLSGADRAEVTATTQIGEEVSKAGDRWLLERVDGCWVILSLTYNLEPAP